MVAGSANSSTSDPIDSVLSIAGSYSICFCYTYAHTTRSAPSTVCTVCTRCSTYAREESSIFIIPELGAADLAVATIASGSSFRWITAELAHFFCLQSKVELLARKIGQQLACACGGFIIHSLFEMDLEFECQADGKSQENIRRTLHQQEAHRSRISRKLQPHLKRIRFLYELTNSV